MFSLLRCGCRLQRLESEAPSLFGLDHNWLSVDGNAAPVQEIAGLENIRATADKMHSVSPGLKCVELC